LHAYNELSHLPMMIHLPDNKRSGDRIKALTQNIDLMPTLLDYYGIDIPISVRGHSLKGLLEGSRDSVRDAVIYGWHGKAVNITDGKHTLFKAPANTENIPCYNYCAIPTTLWQYMGRDNTENIEMGRYLKYTNYPVYRIPAATRANSIGGIGGIEHVSESLMFDIENDYFQCYPIKDEKLMNEMTAKLIKAMKEADSPDEQFLRLDI